MIQNTGVIQSPSQRNANPFYGWEGPIEIPSAKGMSPQNSRQLSLSKNTPKLARLIGKVETVLEEISLVTPRCEKKKFLEVLTWDSDDELTPGQQFKFRSLLEDDFCEVIRVPAPEDSK